jgi:hypothetical protein
MNDQRTPADTIHRDDTLLSAVIDGEVVLMSVEKGRYYALDAIASDIWERLAQTPTFADLVAGLSTAYRGSRADIETDVTALLAHFAEAGLISSSGSV